jgi:hypothetical protein
MFSKLNSAAANDGNRLFFGQGAPEWAMACFGNGRNGFLLLRTFFPYPIYTLIWAKRKGFMCFPCT